MSCCEEWICVNGRSYKANFVRRPDGGIISGTYADENFNLQNVPQGGFTFGECSVAATPDVIPISQSLTAGNNIITHNRGSSPVEITVWDTRFTPMLRVDHGLIAENPNAITISVVNPIPNALIRIDV
jgi:hypothetical protein